MWDADSGAFVSQSVFYELNALPLQVMVIDPPTDQVVVGGMDGKLHWLDAAGAIQHTRVPSGETSYTAIAAHNDWIAINARDDTVRVWNLQQQQWQLIDQQPSGFMAFSDDGRWLAAIGDNAIVTWDTSASFTKQVYPFDTLQFPNHIHFVQNSSLLAIAKRTEFTVVDASTGNVQGSISTGDEQNNITSITSNGNYLVAGFRDGTIRFWQLPGLTEIPNWIVQTIGPVVDLELGHTALDLFSASYTSRPGHPADNSYQYWRLSSALDIAPEPGWNFPIRFGMGEFELVPNGTAGVELHEDGFMAFASEPDYLFSGRNEYDASTPSLHITIANGGLYVVVGSPNELSVWGDGITLPPPPPPPPPPTDCAEGFTIADGDTATLISAITAANTHSYAYTYLYHRNSGSKQKRLLAPGTCTHRAI
jgi:WD40 repeat protein